MYFACCFVIIMLASRTLSLKMSTFKCFASPKRLFSRPVANHLTLDAGLLSEQPDLVIKHLESRGADASLINNILKMHELKAIRHTCVSEGDQARSLRKLLSKEIGLCMKKGDTEEANNLKKKVQVAVNIATDSDHKLDCIDRKIESILSFVPNLLDDRYSTVILLLFCI
jgi:seryl-tRNA synthetase